MSVLSMFLVETRFEGRMYRPSGQRCEAFILGVFATSSKMTAMKSLPIAHRRYQSPQMASTCRPKMLHSVALWGFGFPGGIFPGAYAPGYYMPPLRGSGQAGQFEPAALQNVVTRRVGGAI
jgi:hypothetical protein